MIVNNIRHTTINIGGNTFPNKSLPGWQQQLMQFFEEYMKSMPVKELSRELRSFFLLHVSGHTTIPPGFENRVLKMLVILEMLDDAEDAE